MTPSPGLRNAAPLKARPNAARLFALSLGTTAALVPAAAAAQDRLDTIEAQMQRLMQEIEQLKQERAEQDRVIEELREQVEADAAERTARVEPGETAPERPLPGLEPPDGVQAVPETEPDGGETGARVEPGETAPERPLPETQPPELPRIEPGIDRRFDTVRVTLSGQVNRGVLYGNNGSDQDFFHVDNDSSSTRFTLISESDLTRDITIGSQIELEAQSNASNIVGFEDSSDFFVEERQLELFVTSERFGALRVGQGDTASDNTSEVDLSGTFMIGYSSIEDIAGGLEFANDEGELGPALNLVYDNFDGLGRDDRLRYDSPRLFGLGLRTSAVTDGAWDVALDYGGQFGRTAVGAAVAFADAESTAGFRQFNGSASANIPVAENVFVTLTGAGGLQFIDSGPREPWFLYGKLGMQIDATDLGRTSFGIDFTESQDILVAGDEAQSYAIFGVQRLDPVGTEVYLGVRNHELDSPADDFDNIIAVLTGARVRF